MKKIVTLGSFLLVGSLSAMNAPDIDACNQPLQTTAFGNVVTAAVNFDEINLEIQEKRNRELAVQAKNLMPKAAELAKAHGITEAEYQERRFAGSPIHS